MRTPSAQADKPELLIIDSKRLRQAGIACFLEIWAEAMELALRYAVLDAPIHLSCAPANCKMIIITLGSASIEIPNTKRWRKECAGLWFRRTSFVKMMRLERGQVICNKRRLDGSQGTGSRCYEVCVCLKLSRSLSLQS
jgi:hypothetical protein